MEVLYQDELFEISTRDGIMYGKYIGQLEMDLKIAKLMVDIRLKVQEGKDYPHIIHLSLKKVTKEARDYMNGEGLQGILAGAFMTKSFMTKTILNFYLSVNKPKVPAKVFNNEREAIIWLKRVTKKIKEEQDLTLAN